MKRCMKFQAAIKGTSPAVLRKLMKDDDLSINKFPINTNPRQPVLLISDHSDVDKNNKEEVAEEKAKAQAKKQAQEEILHEIKAKLVLKMKQGPHLCTSHQEVPPPAALAGDNTLPVIKSKHVPIPLTEDNATFV